jgi:hypothetical protein
MRPVLALRRTRWADSLPSNFRRAAPPICPDLIFDRHKAIKLTNDPARTAAEIQNGSELIEACAETREDFQKVLRLTLPLKEGVDIGVLRPGGGAQLRGGIGKPSGAPFIKYGTLLQPRRIRLAMPLATFCDVTATVRQWRDFRDGSIVLKKSFLADE